MKFRLPLFLLTTLALGCGAAPPPAAPPADDERLFATARSCDPSTPECARLRAEATGRATRDDADRATKRAKTFSFAPR